MKRFWLLLSQTVTVVLAVYFVVSTLKPQWLAAMPAAQPGHNTLRYAAQVASPAVVRIQVVNNTQDEPGGIDPWFKFFFDDGSAGQTPDHNNVGSGVIVSSGGLMLTNNHVVEGADDIRVTLLDGRDARATILGTDPDTDLAVLQIALNNLPAIALGDSDALFVGDILLAIGNPFGVGQTVTSGIVSALGRNHLGINTFENFIQTDAAINPGNSGGALVNTQGQLVGINTAIYSRSGGSMGIGFAIPTSVAKSVLDSIVNNGAVTRGWIGIEPQTLNAELAASFGLQKTAGVLVAGVLQQGPAAAAGVRPGDIITTVNAQTVTSISDLLAQVSALTPGEPATLGVWRDGVNTALAISPEARPHPTHGGVPR
jgi:serine protease DegQ